MSYLNYLMQLTSIMLRYPVHGDWHKHAATNADKYKTLKHHANHHKLDKAEIKHRTIICKLILLYKKAQNK